MIDKQEARGDYNGDPRDSHMLQNVIAVIK
jgi:hypothetical protein